MASLNDYQKQKWFLDTINQLKRHEGFRSKLYKDPSETSNVYSIGYGFNTSEPFVKRILNRYGWNNGKTINEDQADKALQNIAYSMIPVIKNKIPNYDNLPDNAKGVSLNMAYQLGQNKFYNFKNMIDALNKNDLKTAEKEMANSEWGRNNKLKNRTMELRHQMYPAAIPNYNPNLDYTKIDPNNMPMNVDKNGVYRKGNRTYYNIQKGDTLGNVSKKQNIPLKNILKLNPKVNPNKLQIGQPIRLTQNFDNTNINPNLNNSMMVHQASVNLNKIAKTLLNKSSAMKKDVPVDLSVKPTFLNKDNVPVVAKRLFNRIVKDTNKETK